MMGYQFKQQESLTTGVQRIAREQLSQAILELKQSEQNPHRAIHEVRKQFKKLRGLIRLVRSGLGGEYSRLNVWYRDAGRGLSRVRDAESMLESLQKLRERFPDSTCEELFLDFENKFVTRKQKIVDEWIDLDLSKLRDQLKVAYESIEAWKIKGKAGQVLSQSLKQNYQHGAEALKKLHQNPDDNLFHDCRKRSKYLLYHMKLINESWKPILSAYIVELDLLNNLLGDDHDLAVMTHLITGETETFQSSANVNRFQALICQQRQEFQSAALQLADRIYAEKPKAFARRMRVYWTLWRDGHSD
ncbi:MAG: CHAD domain-containing protein [Planctomycetes bacterium]|nr:CHAD domain-containing protein [Planctomycetota bacterium]MCH9727579.1 CHAD domain-containing protein [Planctomycetota bacterium]MCH9777441.1 CHAD domain-containing protein [Planctomycetota bacterium]MCH9790436.1 CHAD domain-containing protein [Planctomycetota bacterium]